MIRVAWTQEIQSVPEIAKKRRAPKSTAGNISKKNSTDNRSNNTCELNLGRNLKQISSLSISILLRSFRMDKKQSNQRKFSLMIQIRGRLLYVFQSKECTKFRSTAPLRILRANIRRDSSNLFGPMDEISLQHLETLKPIIITQK